MPSVTGSEALEKFEEEQYNDEGAKPSHRDIEVGKLEAQRNHGIRDEFRRIIVFLVYALLGATQ
uniref:Uncharacterized protein n=1 Tax=Romanomermis culicivorax TaxID=13658 RepID=A0A915KFP6_ROMCU